MRPIRVLPLLTAVVLAGAQLSLLGQWSEDTQIELDGRISDGEKKMAGCEVITYKDNEPIATVTTDNSGRFGMMLELNASYGLEFRKEGFVAKRIVIDTHMPKMSEDTEVLIAPISMDLSLLEKVKYDGADTDDLDFPFALVKWNKSAGAFVQDQEYTMGMQRTNGALLLMAARSGRNGK